MSTRALLRKYFLPRTDNFYTPRIWAESAETVSSIARWIAIHKKTYYVQSYSDILAKPMGIPYPTLGEAVVAAIALMRMEIPE